MIRSRNILFVLGLASAGLPACMVSGSGTMRVSATPVVVYNEPPAEQEEEVTVRPGYLWVKGRWDWRNGKWDWIGGRWEAERGGQAWSQGRWERRGNQWHWIEGSWTVSSDDAHGGGTVVTPHTHTETHNPPPPPPDQGPVVRDHRDHGGGGGSGPVVRDHRDHGGASGAPNPMYPTQAPPPARTENYGAARTGFVWIGGRWELQGNYYVWIEGRWGTR